MACDEGTRTYRIVILGAGLSGLSLARALARREVSGPILIVDRKPAMADDRTWCYWETPGCDFSDLAIMRWDRWNYRDVSGVYEQRSERHRYTCIRGIDFYRRSLDDIRDAAIDVAFDEHVLNVREEARECAIVTRKRTLRAERVFDARGIAPGMHDRHAIVQRFAGYRVQTATPAFDPRSATLMDVQPDTEDGFHFFYVLPFGEREALIENTYFALRPIGAARLRRELDDYARRFERHAPVVAHVETGAIPMSAGRDLPQETRRYTPIGLRGGCARPGSGYTFHRVQEQVARIAESLARGERPVRTFAAKAPVCDRIFLDILRRRPDLAPRIFRRLFASTNGGSLARFMMDAPSLLDSTLVVGASGAGALEGALAAPRPEKATPLYANR